MWETIKAKVKGAWKSFTIWFNGFAIAIIPVVDQAKDLVPQLENYIDQHIFKQVMLWVLVAGNLLLRFKTTKDLAEK